MSPFKNSLNFSSPKNKKHLPNKSILKNNHKQTIKPVLNDDDLDNYLDNSDLINENKGNENNESDMFKNAFKNEKKKNIKDNSINYKNK